MIFNERIRLLRTEHDLTQAQVAAEAGITLRAYQRMEADSKPHYDTLLKLADFYAVSTDWLMGRTERRERLL